MGAFFSDDAAVPHHMQPPIKVPAPPPPPVPPPVLSEHKITFQAVVNPIIINEPWRFIVTKVIEVTTARGIIVTIRTLPQIKRILTAVGAIMMNGALWPGFLM